MSRGREQNPLVQYHLIDHAAERAHRDAHRLRDVSQVIDPDTGAAADKQALAERIIGEVEGTAARGLPQKLEFPRLGRGRRKQAAYS